MQPLEPSAFSVPAKPVTKPPDTFAVPVATPLLRGPCCHADDGRIIFKGAKHDRCARCVVDCKDDGVGDDVVEVDVGGEDKIVGIERKENLVLKPYEIEVAATLNSRERGRKHLD